MIGGPQAAALRVRERILAGELGLAAAGLAAAAAAADAYDAGGALKPDVLRDYLLTNGAGIMRLAVVALVALAALVARVASRRAAAPFAVLALVALAASGHAGSAPAPGLAIAADAVHLVAGAVWLGGIAVMVLLWGPLVRRGGTAVRRAIARHALPAFGRVALPAFGVVVVSGTVSAVIELGHLDAIGGTAYGRVLALKVFVVAVIAAVSREHAVRLRRRLPSGPGEPETARRATPLAAVAHRAAARRRRRRGRRVPGGVPAPAAPARRRRGGAGGGAGDAVRSRARCRAPGPASWRWRRTRAPSWSAPGCAGPRQGSRARLGSSTCAGGPWRRAFTVAGAARQRRCGTGCARFVRPGRGTLVVRVPARDRVHVARIGTRWQPGASARARRLLERAEAAMRALRSARQTEEQTSGPGSYARTDYVLRAPDRMRLSTDTGTRSVIIGERQWLRTRDSGGWIRQRFGSGLPFSTRRWFRFTPFAIDVRWLGSRRDASGRLLTTIALVDPGTPVWSRLTIDRATNRIVRERSHNPGHYADERYFGFNRPVRIEAPDG